MAVTNNFSASTLDLNGKVALSQPTALVWGPDGRLYVTEVDGDVKVLTVAFGDNPADGVTTAKFYVTGAVTLNLVKGAIQNHNDNGATSAVANRQVTGIDVTPQFDAAGSPMLLPDGAPMVTVYVTSSDSRIGAGGDGADANLDTNSGVITKMVQTGPDAWTPIDIVRGLPRSEENHATNGLEVVQTFDQSGKLVSERLVVASGGNTNTGAPSNNFAGQQEQPLSAAILEVDLDAINALPVQVGAGGRQYVYDLPTLNDPTRTGTADANDPFGGNDGLNSAKLLDGGPVTVYSPGYRNAYDVLVTEDGRFWTYDNGANNSWGGRPIGEAGDNGALNDLALANGYIALNVNNGEGNTNDPINLVNWGPGNKDQFHEITRSDDLAGRALSAGQGGAQTFVHDGLTYVYGGHPNPTRAEGSRAGLLFSPGAGAGDAYLLVSNQDSYGNGGGSDYAEVVAWLQKVEAANPKNGIYGVNAGDLTEKVLSVTPGVSYDIYKFADGSGAAVVKGGAAPAGGALIGSAGLPADIADIVAYVNPIEGDYKEGGRTDGALDSGTGSINGIAEYTSTVLDAGGVKMSGAIIATQLNGASLIVMGRNADGSMSSASSGGFAVAADRTTISAGGGPLGIDTVGDDYLERGLTQPFRGSIWTATYNQNGPLIEIFQPANGAVPLAGTNILNPGDRDFDGVGNVFDPFEFDAGNGYRLDAGESLVIDFNPQNANFPTSISGTGLLGAALDGDTPNRDAQTAAENFPLAQQFDGLFDIGGNVLPGGNAPILQIKKVVAGTVVGAANTARDALHTGIRPTEDVGGVVATVALKNWIPEAGGVEAGQLTGMMFGDGTQANFLRVVFGAVNGQPGIEVGYEIGDANYTALAKVAVPGLSDAAVNALELRLSIDMENDFAVRVAYRLEGQANFVEVNLGGFELPAGVLRDVLTGDHTIGAGAAQTPSGAAIGFLAETSSGAPLEAIDFYDLTIQALEKTQGATVLYRVNAGSGGGAAANASAGAGTIAAIDGGPDWIGDATLINSAGPVSLTGASGQAYTQALTNQQSEIESGNVDLAETPWQLFVNERGDVTNDAAKLTYDFDVEVGRTYEITLYYTENWNGIFNYAATNGGATRQFDVTVEGQLLPGFTDINPMAEAAAKLGLPLPTAAQTALHQQFLGLAFERTVSYVATDDTLSLQFEHDVQNPKINAIQVAVLGGPSVDPADIDGDAIANAADPFAHDASNGLSKALSAGGSFRQDFDVDTTDLFGPAAGFSGVVVNPAFTPPGASGADPYGDRTTEATSFVAGGVLKVTSSETDLFGPTGVPANPTGADNTIKDNFQSGADVSDVDRFSVEARAINPFAGGAPAQFAAFGITLGAGGVDDYVKLVYGGSGTGPRIQLAQEDSLTGAKDENVALAAQGLNPAEVASIVFRIDVDKSGPIATLQGFATLFDATGDTIGVISTSLRSVTGSLAQALAGANPLTGGVGGVAYGVSITDWGGGDANRFVGQWDYLEIASPALPNLAPTGIVLTPVVTSLSETAATAARVKVADIAVTDDGLGSNLLSLAGADAALFEIDGAGLYVRAGAALDFETDPQLDVTVVVDDPTAGGAPDATAAFSLALADANEFAVTAPMDVDAAENAVSEAAANGAAVGITARATDADATVNGVSYVLADAAGGRFAIDAATGVVRVADATLLDFETAAAHQIVVRATSADGSTADTVFTVAVRDAAEGGGGLDPISFGLVQLKPGVTPATAPNALTVADQGATTSDVNRALVALVGDGDTLLETGETAFVLGRGTSGANKILDLGARNGADDPVAIGAHGRLSAGAVGEIDPEAGATTAVVYNRAWGFGLQSAGETNGRGLSRGDALSWTLNPDGGAPQRLASFGFTVNTGTATADTEVAIDFDGTVARSGAYGTAATAANADAALRLVARNGDTIAVDFDARTLSLNGAALTGAAIPAFFAAYDAGPKTTLTIGGIGTVGFTVADLVIGRSVETGGPVNLAPTGIVLTPVVTSLSETAATAARVKVADIAVTDDGLGSNLLSLAGADAALFEIDGAGLYVRAGAALDFETDPQLDVTVVVDDPTAGGAPDATAAFSLALTAANAFAALGPDGDLDGDALANKADPDIDADGTPNTTDLFYYDAANGRPLAAGEVVRLDFDAPGTPFQNGFTGVMQGVASAAGYQKDTGAGVVAGGKLVVTTTAGDTGATNDPQNDYHFGIKRGGGFTVETVIDNPFASAAKASFKQLGLAISLDSTDFLKFVAGNVGGAFEFSYNNDDVATKVTGELPAGFKLFGSDAGTLVAKLRLVVEVSVGAGGEAVATATATLLDGAGAPVAGTSPVTLAPLALAGDLEAALADPARAVGVGVTHTSGTGAPFQAAFDYLEVRADGAALGAPSAIALSNAGVAENAPGATVGALTVSEPDGDPVTLAVDDARFEIVGGQLKLKAGQALDFETTAAVSVAVTATDKDGALTRSFVIGVQNDPADDPATDVRALVAGAGGVATTDSYAPGTVGAAVLRILPGDENVQRSNFGAKSFQFENVGDKKVAALFIDVRGALYPDSVFDDDGSGGDDVAKDFAFAAGSDASALAPSAYAHFFLPARAGANPLFTADKQDSGKGADGGWRGLLLKFGAAGGGFVKGDTAAFAGDMDPNSIAGLLKGTVDAFSTPAWDVGGVSGAELIGSRITVMFSDGSFAEGQLFGDGSQAGAQALISQAIDLGTAPAARLTVNGVADGGVGTYGGTVPSVIVEGPAGATVRVVMTKGFDPVANPKPIAGATVDTLVADRLAAYDFKASNAAEFQTLDVVIPAAGAIDVGALFAYGGAPNGNAGVPNFAKLQLGFAAAVIHPASTLPLGPVSDPIYLSNSGQAVAGGAATPPGAGASGGGGTEGFFQAIQSGASVRFKAQFEDANVAGTDPGGLWSFRDAPDAAGNQSGFQGAGYYLWGAETSLALTATPQAASFLPYTILVPEGQGGAYTLRLRASRDASAPDGEQNDVWVRVDQDAEALLVNKTDAVSSGGFVKLFGGGTGGFGFASGIDSVLEGEPNFAAVFNLAPGLHTLTFAGRSQGFHLDFWELFKGAAPALGATNSAFVPTGPSAPKVSDPIDDVTIVTTVGGTITVPAGAFTDLDGDALVLSAAIPGALQGVVTFDATARSFTVAPGAPLGVYAIAVAATDDDGNVATDAFALTIAAAPNVPILGVTRAAIAASADDFELIGGATSADLEFGVQNGKANSVGLRFTGLDLSEGADIESAYFLFEAEATNTAAATFKIEIETSTSAASYSTANGVNARSYAAQSVAWTNVAPWQKDQLQQSVDVTALIEAAIGTGGLDAQDALGFRITGVGTRQAYSFDSAGEAPQLVINYVDDPLL